MKLRHGEIIERPKCGKEGRFARIKKGRVVRVDRKTTLEDATIGLGIAFE